MTPAAQTEALSAPPTLTARARPTWQVPCPQELTLLAVGIAMYGLLPGDLGLLSNIAVMSLLALSLNFVLGQAGIASMGHAALFGAGGYTAGLVALHMSPNPLVGLAAGGVAGLLVALASGFVLLRARGLTQVMLTIASAQLLLELANWARSVTGGDDGLTGFAVAPLFGVFGFDFEGKVGYLYSLCVLVLVFFALRKLVASPFGLTTRAIRLDAGRVEALGGRVFLHLLMVYAIGGFVAGLAGAIMTQTTKVASLSMLDFNLSASVLIMVVLGGTSRLGGAILGAFAYMAIHHVASNLSPHHWLLVIGLMLIATMMHLPGGLIQLVDLARRRHVRGAAKTGGQQ